MSNTLFDKHPTGLTPEAEAAQLARKAGPSTSKAAAASVVSGGTVGRHESAILHALSLWVPGGAYMNPSSNRTSHEIAECATYKSKGKTKTLSREQVHKRLRGMKRKGLIERCEKRACRCGNCRGLDMTTWRAK